MDDSGKSSSSDGEGSSTTETSRVSERHSASDAGKSDENNEIQVKLEGQDEEAVEQTFISSGNGAGGDTVSDPKETGKEIEDKTDIPAAPGPVEEVECETPSREIFDSRRFVSDAVPMMNTQQVDDLNVITERMARAGGPSTKSSSPQPLRLQNYQNVQGPSGSSPAYNSYQATNKKVARSRPEAVSVWASGSRSAPAPQPLGIPPAAYQVPDQATATSPSWRPGGAGEQARTGRKGSVGSATYIGSRVISEQTGPSLTIMLRRPTSERQWGFSFHGGAEYGCPPFVNKISKHSPALSFGLELGDVLVSISNALTVGKRQDQLKAEILRAGNELDLIIIRRGVDLAKIAELVPQAIPTSPRSPSSNSPLSSRENSTVCVFDESRQRSARSLNRPQLYRPVKTKSMRILEDQLDAGQATSAVTTKQHFQGARGLGAQGERSSFTQAYGEARAGGYAGRVIIATATPCETTYWPQKAESQMETPSYRLPEQVRAQQSYGQSNWSQPPSQPTTAWGSRAAFSGQQAPVADSRFGDRSGHSTVYPSSSSQGPSYSSSTTVTIPTRGRPPYDNYHMTR